MDILEEVEKAEKQELTHKDEALTYEKFNELISNRLQRIFGEYHMLKRELGEVIPHCEIEKVMEIITEQQLKLADFHEELKKCYFGPLYMKEKKVERKFC